MVFHVTRSGIHLIACQDKTVPVLAKIIKMVLYIRWQSALACAETTHKIELFLRHFITEYSIQSSKSIVSENSSICHCNNVWAETVTVMLTFYPWITMKLWIGLIRSIISYLKIIQSYPDGHIQRGDDSNVEMSFFIIPFSLRIV